MAAVTYTVWDGLKASLGALGSVLIAVPWLRDFDWRRRRDRFADVTFGGASGASFKARMLEVYRRKVETPRVSDLVLTLLGLAGIFLSYLIALSSGILQRMSV